MGKNTSAVYDALPVENLTWYDAILFCNKKSKMKNLDTVYSYTSRTIGSDGSCTNLASLSRNPNKNGYRLPTKEEWMLIYRAGTTNDYVWPIGADINKYAWHLGNSPQRKTQTVGTKLPNSWGIYDMAGNVAEWTDSQDGSTGKVYVINGSVDNDYSTLKYNSFPSPDNGLRDKNSVSCYRGFRIVRKSVDISPTLQLLLE